jgi:replicative DNA helicase
LLRLDIRSRLTSAGKDGHRVRWDVSVGGGADRVAFQYVLGGHNVICPDLHVLAESDPDPNSDVIPASIAPAANAALRRAGLTLREAVELQHEQTSNASAGGPGPAQGVVSRRLLGMIAAAAGDRHLRALAESEVFWDQIVEVASLGEMPTFDATVAGTHNFVANGVIAHNSLEQDADVVLFLYRDEMYNPESADRGSAEVIVAKHRNGPTGKCQLAFLDHYTRFANMARV